MAAQLWVIGPRKGGVGKTFIASSLGITLGKLNRSVLLIDFDCSGANLHTCFGAKLGEKTMRSYFSGKDSLVNLIQTTNIPRVSYIQGFWDSWEPQSVSVDETQKLIQEARSLPFDYVIFDCGPGYHVQNLELFAAADEKILVTNPEPNAVEKTYRFVESYICHRLKEKTSPEAHIKLQATLESYREKRGREFFSFRRYLATEMNYAPDYFEALNENPLRLIINGSRSQHDQALGYSMKSVCSKFFDLNVDCLGSIDYDNAVWQSLRERVPFLIHKPFTPLAGQFLALTKDLVTPNFNTTVYRAVV